MSDWITDYYADVDALRLEPFVARHAEDAVVVFGNQPPTVGIAAIHDAFEGFFGMIGGMRHEVHHRWDVDDGATVILEVTTHYTTKGGAPVPLPCVSILDRDAEGKVTSLRIHIDLAPLFAAMAQEAQPVS
ncbi:ketosteroid isomerase-like protein [Actinomycetospora succinea]|uniref:Ketosteroid isomerase-like protein n=1 Tax=Actinomycetospora succinea TaxID=663603 RepID=A0A4R6VKX5_9PSEU|nr:nuclear transport factor 2 family protein [Actinomycetospora succinea]TDQ62532.1 ketosteroid isomerase-like protein [Actinomycetospora succinea]